HLPADRLDGTKQLPEGAPAEPVVADVEEVKLLAAEVERHLPTGVVGVEEVRADVRPQRVERRLGDLVAQGVADLDPTSAGLRVGMVVVADYAERVVVLAVAVDYHAALAGHRGH